MWVRRGVVTFIVLLVLVVVGAALADSLAYRDRIHPGVRVWGLDLGGLRSGEAERALEKKAVSLLAEPIAVGGGPTSVRVVPLEAGIGLDVDSTVKAARGAADGGPWWRDLTRRASLWARGADVQPVLSVVDPAAWEQALDDVALGVERLPRDARLILTDDGPKAVAAADGVVLDRAGLQKRVVRAALTADSPAYHQVSAPTITVSPEVTTDQARSALDAARLAFSAPVQLAYRGHTYEVTGEQLSSIAEVRKGGAALESPLTFDTPEAQALLEKRLAGVTTPPVDAQIVPEQSGKGFTVVPSHEGRTVEWEPLLAALGRAALSRDRRYVPIPTTQSQPKLTTEDAEQLRDRREISSFTTYFSSSNQARVNNIRQVAEYLDGVVIRPGETFSFNKTVGPRTKAAGFDEAPVIRDGVLTPGVGGGICQVSTTLFNAVFFAGLPVVERRPHSFFIDHYPVGRDATVSYGAVDFKFRNDTDQVLLLTATAGDRSVRVSLAAPQWERTVTYSTSRFTNVVPPSSTEKRPRRLRDPQLEAGQLSPVEKGIDGRSVDVTRTVKGAGGRVLFTDTFTSTYQPKDFVVRVGG